MVKFRELTRFLESSEEEESEEESEKMESSDSEEMESDMEMEEKEENLLSDQPKQSPIEQKKEKLNTLSQLQKQLLDMKQKLLTLVQSETFPLNPLDELIDRLGGESKVAEMTGRSYRILHHHPAVADSSTDLYQAFFEKEHPDKVATDEDIHLNEDYYFYSSRGVKRGSEEGANMKEKQLFQKGIKKVAIISEAASAGISLHADRSVPNQLKRVHIILELPWSADKIIQQCGRSHRSNQRVPPDYVFLLSSIGGELRFVSTLSKRLKALGALTQGSRNATGALDFSSFDYDSTYARNAGTLMINTILNQESSDSAPSPPYGSTLYLPGSYTYSNPMSEEEKKEYQAYLDDSGGGRLYRMKTWLVQVGVHLQKTELLVLFFNRIMGLELFKQFLLIAYLNEVKFGKNHSLGCGEGNLSPSANGGFGSRVKSNYRKEDHSHTRTRSRVHRSSNQCTNHALRNRGMSKCELSRIEGYEKEGVLLIWEFHHRKFFKSSSGNHVIFAYSETVLPSQWKPTTELHIIRPATGDAANIWLFKDICAKYKEVPNGKELWKKQWESSQHQCVHGENCTRPHCEQGKAKQTVHIISGQFVVLWGFIHNCVPRGKHLRLVQVSVTDRDLTIMGVRIQASGVQQLKVQLKEMENVQKQEMKKQEKLTEAYRNREEKERLKAIERKQREKERRKEREKAKSLEILDMLDYGREKRARKPVYRDPTMPPLIPICSLEEWKVEGMKYFTMELKRDKTMPTLLALHEEKRVKKESIDTTQKSMDSKESTSKQEESSSSNQIIEQSSSGERSSDESPNAN